MTLDEARTLYPDIKTLTARVSPHFCESYNVSTSTSEICVHDDRSGEVEPIAHILPSCAYDDRMLLIRAPVYLAALVLLTEEAFRLLREMKPKPSHRRDSVAQACGRMCNNRDFLRFLAVCHGVDISDGERVASRVRTMLSIETRAQLDSDEAAHKRWFSLYRSFKAWARGAGGR